MKSDSIIGLVIITITALIMIIIGIYQLTRKDTPVGFYNVTEPPKKEDISNVLKWNQKHGLLWLGYGICVEFGYWIAYFMPTTVLQAVFLLGGIIIPLPLLVIAHSALVRKYYKKKD